MIFLFQRKIMLLVVCCIIIMSSLYGAESKIDSLKCILQQYDNGDTSQAHVQTIIELGDALWWEGELWAGVETFKKGLKLAEKTANTKYITHCHLAIGRLCFRQANYTCARASLYFVLDAPYPTVTARDSAEVYRALGDVNIYDGNLEEASSYHIEAVKIYERLKDTLHIAGFYYAVGHIKLKQDTPNRAIEFFNKAQNMYNAIGEKYSMVSCVSMKGEAYKKIGDYEKAVSCLEQALLYDLENGNSPYDIGYSTHALGSILVELGQLKRAEALLLQSLEMRKEYGDQEELIETYGTLGSLYTHKRNYRKAFEYFDVAIARAKELNIRPLMEKVYKQMSDAYLHFDQYEEAYFCIKKYYEIKEALVNEKTEKSIAALYATHELEKKEQDLIIKEREIEDLMKEKKLNLLSKWLLITGLIALSIFILAGILLFKKQLNYNTVLAGKNNRIEEQNHDLIDMNKKLERANKDLEQFAYISSHDLKTPLRNIGNYAGLLRQQYAKSLDKNALTFLGFITDGIEQMSALLDNILSYSLVTKSQVKREVVDLGDSVNKVLHNLNPMIAERQAEVDFQLLLAVEGDAIQIMQVFQNLIGNAIKFVPADRCPVIRVRGEGVENDMYKIAIIDNGVGIKRENQKKIFEIFKRLHTDAEFKGTGIGLSICKKIINRHGGEIWVTSDGETGTTFYFTLPKANPVLLNKPKDLHKTIASQTVL